MHDTISPRKTRDCHCSYNSKESVRYQYENVKRLRMENIRIGLTGARFFAKISKKVWNMEEVRDLNSKTKIMVLWRDLTKVISILH